MLFRATSNVTFLSEVSITKKTVPRLSRETYQKERNVLRASQEVIMRFARVICRCHITDGGLSAFIFKMRMLVTVFLV